MRIIMLGVIAAAALPMVASAQTLQQRIDDRAQRQAADREDIARLQREARRQTGAAMNNLFRLVQIDLPLRDAVAWWSAAAKIPLVVNWEQMEDHGVDPQARVELDLETVAVHDALRLMLQTTTPGMDFVWDVEPGYLHLMTREQANRMPVIAVYDVADLLMEVPNFTDVPEFDLSKILDGGEAGGGQLFRERDQEDTRLTRSERGEELAQLIRDTVEPLIWDANGGSYGHSVRYWNGRLVVRAPRYVQRQIGTPVIVRSITPRASRE